MRTLLAAAGLTLAMLVPAAADDLIQGSELCPECGYFGETAGEVKTSYRPLIGDPDASTPARDAIVTQTVASAQAATAPPAR
jgi:hypothetical protein